MNTDRRTNSTDRRKRPGQERTPLRPAVSMALALCSPQAVRAVDIADTVNWNVIGRDVQISAPQITAVSAGNFNGNTAIVGSGASISLTGSYQIQQGDTSFCPTCIIQLYTAWIAPAPAASQVFFDGLINPEIPDVIPAFGTQSGQLPLWTSLAPTQPGIYYIGLASTLQFQPLPDQAGAFGASQESPTDTFAPFRIQVIGTPLPPNPLGNTLNLDVEVTYGITQDYANGGTLNSPTFTSIIIPSATTLSNTGTLNNGGTIESTGTLNNPGTLTLTGTVINGGTLVSSGTLNIAGGQVVDGSTADLPSGTVVQTGGSTTLSAGGLLSTPRLDLQSGSLNLQDGTLQTGTFDNQGNFVYSGGSFTGDLNNRGTVNLSGSGTRSFNGNVVNDGTFKVTDTQVAFNGSFTNNGAYISDPSTNQFNTLAVGSNGYLVGGTGDNFIITGDFLNASTQNTLWNTEKASLIFADSGSAAREGQHILQLAGADKGAQAQGFLDNFAWGSLTLNSGQSLVLQDGNGTAGGAFYARTINLPGGLAQLANITSDFNIYFDPTLQANQAFLGGAAFGGGTGQILPWSFVPDASAVAQAFGMTPDQQSFASAIDEACLSPSGSLALRCAQLQALTPTQKQGAIASLTPDQVPNQTGIPVKFNASRIDAVLTRLTGLRRGETPSFSFNLNGLQYSKNILLKAAEEVDSPLRDNPLGVFIQSRFNFGGVDPNPAERGSNFQTRNVTMGVDYRFTDQLVAGVAFNYTSVSSHYDAAAGALGSDTFLGAFYGSYYFPEDFFVDWLANYGGSDYSFNRSFSYPGFAGQTQAKPSGDQFDFAVSGGRDFNFGAWQLSPLVRFEYLNLHIGSYDETGGGGFATTVGGQLNHSLVSDLGLQVGRAISVPFGVITPSVRVEWEHQYLNDNRPIAMRLSDASGGTGNFTITTGAPDRDYVNLGGSLSAALPNGGGLFIRYETRLGQSDLTQHIVEGGIQMSF